MPAKAQILKCFNPSFSLRKLILAVAKDSIKQDLTGFLTLNHKRPFVGFVAILVHCLDQSPFDSL